MEVNMEKSDMETIQSKIFVLRGIKVMLDKDLAELYGVDTKRLNEQVKRNEARFPDDFMFQLSEKEWELLRSQFATLEGKGRYTKYLPFAFTQNGIAMLSTVLSSEKAIEVNIRIMRVFIKTSEFLRNHEEIYKKIKKLEKKANKNDKDIEMIFQAINELYGYQEEEKRIGF